MGQRDKGLGPPAATKERLGLVEDQHARTALWVCGMWCTELRRRRDSDVPRTFMFPHKDRDSRQKLAVALQRVLRAACQLFLPIPFLSF